jgi:hypothetical protein
MTPTKTPSPTPTQKPLPTSTPTRTPTPIPNNRPVIVTTSLPIGKVHANYSAQVEGNDQDKNNSLKINTTNLPGGFTLKNCRQFVKNNKKVISCTIIGWPLKEGKYNVVVTLKDSKGASVRKTLILQVTGNK